MRIGYIDSFKGLGILGIVMFHVDDTGMPSCLRQFIVYWAVFSFFFISGWIYRVKRKNHAPGEYFRARLNRFGRVYVVFTLVFIAFDAILVAAGWYEPIVILKDVYKSLVLTGIGTLWFLPVLLLGETLFVAFLDFKRNRKAVICSVVVIICFIVLGMSEYCRNLYNSGHVGQALCMPIGTVGLIGECTLFVSLGYLSAKYILPYILILQNRFGEIGLTLIGSVVLCIAAVISMQIYDWPLLYARLVTVVPLSLAIIMLFMSFEKMALSGFFRFWGRNSLILMCTHYSITLVLIEIADVLINGEATQSSLAIWVYFCLCLLLTYCFIKSRIAERYLRLRIS